MIMMALALEITRYPSHNAVFRQETILNIRQDVAMLGSCSFRLMMIVDQLFWKLIQLGCSF
ncbi:hypothetical protein [Hahella ganghwensis]|uniref:hypothetical protein n=1 Tax=Hahella ganghwensis TaxID=286420 RepID=UPI00037AEF37|nr:hypothetical protein [Hahella ganghwensis]